MSPAARSRLIWLAVCVPVALVVLAGAYCAVALPGCASCHSDAKFVTGTQGSSHAKVACVACHVGPGIADRISYGYLEVFHMVVPLVSGAGRDWASVGDTQCLSCHAKVRNEVVTANGISIAHSTCSVGASCTDCHSSTAHRTSGAWVKTYDMETCLVCHVTKASVACDSCHKGKRPSDRVTTGVFAATHGPQWRKTHGMGNATTCTVCHTAADCKTCHGPGLPHDKEFLKTHPQFAASPDAKCTGCHDAAFCSDCHGLTMPHPQQFVRGHAVPAKATPALCKRCHADSDCTNCHVTHVHPGGAIGGNMPTNPGKK